MKLHYFNYYFYCLINVNFYLLFESMESTSSHLFVTARISSWLWSSFVQSLSLDEQTKRVQLIFGKNYLIPFFKNFFFFNFQYFKTENYFLQTNAQVSQNYNPCGYFDAHKFLYVIIHVRFCFSHLITFLKM